MRTRSQEVALQQPEPLAARDGFESFDELGQAVTCPDLEQQVERQAKRQRQVFAGQT